MPLRCRLAALLILAACGSAALGAPADDIKGLLEKGQAAEAYELGRQHQDQLGNPFFDFYFGVAAIGAGRAGEGVLALERFVVSAPDNINGRLELARGYFVLGEDTRARQEFELVLASSPPPEVQANVQRFLDAIRSREFLYRPTQGFYLEAGLGYDSNANAGVSGASITRWTIPLQINSAGVKQSDSFHTLGGGFSFSRPIQPGLFAVIGGGFDGRYHHSESRLDQQGLRIDGGLTWIRIPLTFGSPIEARDTLQTGQRSNLQVRLTDESILSLREQTQMRIEDYKYSGKPDGDESAVFRLVKGAFRTVTGLIGRSNHARYAVRTPSATIGIRGTMYAAGVCDKDCFNADGSLARDGLYGMVIGQSQGTNKLALTNKAGETIVRQGQVFFVASDSAAPELMLEPPAHLIDKLAGAGKADRPTATAMGLPGQSEGAVSGALGGLGGLGAGGISSDSRPNALPTSLEQVALVSTNFQTVQVTQNLASGGLPVTLPAIQSQSFVDIGGTGIVRGQMLWTTTADMDLHMFTPDGQEVAYSNPTVNFPAALPTAQAQLDIDNTQGVNHPTAVTTFQGQLHAVENIRVTGTTIPTGNYTFFTRNFSGPTTAPILLVTGDNNVTSRRFDVPALTSGATSQNYVVTRNVNGTATYSGPQ